MSLTKEQRDALSSSEFAVPETRDLPIHDATHVKMAWKMVDRTKGLSDEQRKRARERILRKAHELGIDTSEWNVRAMKFNAMAVEFPDVEYHPNRIPFSGVLTKVDEPSDNPLNGSNGKRVILPKEVADEALPSLLGMAIDFTPDLDGHDVKAKIGLITEANIIGNEIHIAGFFYGADFPDEVKRIQAEKAQLGFSYEAQARIKSMNDDPLVIDSCFFTGAAVLYKDLAAYTTTSLAAKTEKLEMNKEDLTNILGEFKENLLKEVKEQMTESKKLSAGSIHHLVAPHAAKLREIADQFEAAGIGMHPSVGHTSVLRNMADKMEAEAALGKMPHIYQTSDFMYASADKGEKENKAVKELEDKISSLTSKITDLEKANFQASAAPERKTFSPEVTQLLIKAGLKEDTKELSAAAVDEALDKVGITNPRERMAKKFKLQQEGVLKPQSH